MVPAEPPICLGDPSATRGSLLPSAGCSEVAGIVLVQLRPAPDGRPAIVAIATCPEHVDAVQAFMVESWPHDDIWIDSLDAWLQGIQPAYAEMGYETALLAV